MMFEGGNWHPLRLFVLKTDETDEGSKQMFDGCFYLGVLKVILKTPRLRETFS